MNSNYTLHGDSSNNVGSYVYDQPLKRLKVIKALS